MKLKKIMLIDDDRPTNFIHKIIIGKANCTEEIIVKQKAEDALNMLRQCKENEIPDLILLDINMPEMDGWDFLAAFKKLPAHQKTKVVIIMLTTSLSPLDEKRAENIQEISGFISKPLTILALQEKIKTLFTFSS